MSTNHADFIDLNQFPTGRCLYTFYRVHDIAQAMPAPAIVPLVAEAIAAGQKTHALEQRWATKRRSGKPSAKQLRDQKALQQADIRLDKALSGLRDAGEALLKGADEVEDAQLIADVEHFLHEVFPNGVAAVTNAPYDVELVAVKAIVDKLQGELSPVVQKLGLSLNAERIANLAQKYKEALSAVDTLEFGTVKAAREAGQNYLLRIVARILGTYDEPTGDHAEKRAALLAPVVKQNEAIRHNIRTRRSTPDVDPKTGEEQLPEEAAGGSGLEETTPTNEG
ncbi:hypothetical protein [Polyangium fumosum]|uniref:Uncharacterized protein n=1 Tax=Polyangium fumosum TaxID=889272 RepID=A0A4U1JCF0_9BACT|nr:hypothetical protein [Polyangium fumosum]TKD06495.1 hypothetical protein E8A74_19995 [Polyangium fumosum]